MLKLTLRDIALLKSTFEQKLGEDQPDWETDAYPDEQLLQLAVDTSIDDNEAVAFIEGKLEDERLPFSLTFEMGFLFSIPDGEQVPAAVEVEPTLVWLAFPYLREFIADLTGRSPAPQYFIPPLTRLPQPDPQPPPISG